jgi:cephalosporin hydroxylase
MGTRTGVSTRAFLASDVTLRAYDLFLDDQVQQLFNLAKEEGKDAEYIQANVLEIEIDETDLLFIDTWHCYDQLIAELKLHASKVKKYIAFHDTQTYGTRSEEFMGRVGSNGLLPAIIHYMIENPNDWRFKIHRTNNNGLSVLERIK